MRKERERVGIGEFQRVCWFGVGRGLCKNRHKNTGCFVPEAGAAVMLSLKQEAGATYGVHPESPDGIGGAEGELCELRIDPAEVPLRLDA